MKEEYIGFFVMVLGLLAFLAGLAIYHRSQTPKLESEKKKGVEVVCKACGGAGETEQDVNLLMAKGMYAIWFNGHSYGCETCNKFPDGGPCEADRKKYKEIMDKYEELGPKIEKSVCPSCMGMGEYTQYDGYRFGRERD